MLIVFKNYNVIKFIFKLVLMIFLVKEGCIGYNGCLIWKVFICIVLIIYKRLFIYVFFGLFFFIFKLIKNDFLIFMVYVCNWI